MSYRGRFRGYLTVIVEHRHFACSLLHDNILIAVSDLLSLVSGLAVFRLRTTNSEVHFS